MNRSFLLRLIAVVGAACGFFIFFDAISPGFDISTTLVELLGVGVMMSFLAIFLIGRDHGRKL